MHDARIENQDQGFYLGLGAHSVGAGLLARCIMRGELPHLPTVISSMPREYSHLNHASSAEPGSI